MKKHQASLKEEIAVRNWQRVLSFATGTSIDERSVKKPQRKQSIFEVMP